MDIQRDTQTDTDLLAEQLEVLVVFLRAPTRLLGSDAAHTSLSCLSVSCPLYSTTKGCQMKHCGAKGGQMKHSGAKGYQIKHSRAKTCQIKLYGILNQALWS